MLCLLAFFIVCCISYPSCCRVTPSDGDTSPSGELPGATGGAGAMAIPATSTLSLPMSQGKPSLRRIKGRIHRSKSLDSIDLLDSNVRLATDSFTPANLISIYTPQTGCLSLYIKSLHNYFYCYLLKAHITSHFLETFQNSNFIVQQQM